MDPATAGPEFGRLMQYGAVGIIAAGLLALVVVLFRQFVNHALEQNKHLLERHDELMTQQIAMQSANLKAMGDLVHAIDRMEESSNQRFSSLTKDMGMLFNEFSAFTEGSISRPHRPRPRGSGGPGAGG